MSRETQPFDRDSFPTQNRGTDEVPIPEMSVVTTTKFPSIAHRVVLLFPTVLRDPLNVSSVEILLVDTGH